MTVFWFGEFCLDPRRFELRRGDAPVHVEPQVYDVLLYLLTHRDRVVAKDELVDHVWGSRFVTDTTVSTRIKEARRALDDDGEAQRWIRTVRGRGFQFIGTVVETPADSDADDSAVGNTDTGAATAAVGDAEGHAAGATSLPGAVDNVRFCRGDDGVRIAYAVTGSGPPLVKAANWMTHLGYDAASPVWRHWLSALSAGHRLVRYDERGCGLSQWDVPRFSFEGWVRDLETVVDAVGLSHFPLLGISQGAAVAIAYAVLHPHRVDRLVLVGGYAAGGAVRATSEQERAAAALDVELARVGWGGSDPAFRRVFAMQFYPDGPPWMWDAFDELQRRTTSPENAVRFLQEFATIDVRGLAPHVRCPTLVLHSLGDLRVPYDAAAVPLAKAIPGSRLVSMPSRNHILSAEGPAWPVLLDELRMFLAASDPA